MTNSAFESILKETVRRICSVVQARRIVLFGSASRGQMTANSDLDILVVVPSGTHRRRTAQQIYRNMIGVGFAADIVVVTEDDVTRLKDAPSTVIEPALKEGKLLYAA